MPRVFREGSLSFRYPDNWQLEREDNDHGWTVSVYSPSTAFLTLSLDTDYPDTERVADAAPERRPAPAEHHRHAHKRRREDDDANPAAVRDANLHEAAARAGTAPRARS